ncbi:MAG: 3-hydroxyacyl-CoA dehydrogenase NAD-binding domain-containing protein [Acidobacteriota bacterium]
MRNLVTVHSRGRVSVVVIDNPPVNALTTLVAEEIARAVEAADRDPAVDAVVLAGAGRTFVAGADIDLLEQAAWGDPAAAPNFKSVFRRIESCAKPVVVALHGTALGGGVELAMAASFRVAVATAQLGLPEVTLGIIPGAEGTQRLPRLAGVQTALEMCVTGRAIDAAQALATGLIDAIVEGDPIAGAVAFAEQMAARGGPYPKTSGRTDKLGAPETNAAACASARQLARKLWPRRAAALRAIDAIEAATTLPFAEGSAREAALSAECVRSEEAKALIHLFFAERAVTKPPGLASTAPAAPIERIAIVGAGTMGAGIAMACANAGLTVLLNDTAQAALDSASASIRRNYAISVTRGRLTPEAVNERVARIHPQTGRDGFDGAEVVIEAAFESLALKQRIFGELDAVVAPGAVLATNTSTLSIDAIASATARPAAVVGLHFFSPAHVMRLVEIVRGEATSPEVIATAFALAKRLKKIGVLVGNGPGFVGNRMMFPYMYETQFLVEEGATPQQVDGALTGFGMAMGMFAVDDMAGLDVAWRVRQELGHFRGGETRAPLVADQLYEMGRFGQKSGQGWYRYEDGRTPIPDPDVVEPISTTAASAGIPQRAFTDHDIVERSIYALINEGARVLEEGIALRASDIDVIYANGYGFPAWRGGPMFYADRVGLRTIHDRIVEFQRAFGARWAPAPLLARLAESGGTFRGLDAERRG